LPPAAFSIDVEHEFSIEVKHELGGWRVLPPAAFELRSTLRREVKPAAQPA
jgi:hypothetical protein